MHLKLTFEVYTDLTSSENQNRMRIFVLFCVNKLIVKDEERLASTLTNRPSAFTPNTMDHCIETLLLTHKNTKIHDLDLGDNDVYLQSE